VLPSEVTPLESAWNVHGCPSPPVLAKYDVVGMVVYLAKYPDVFRRSTTRDPVTKIGSPGSLPERSPRLGGGQQDSSGRYRPSLNRPARSCTIHVAATK
jgi:hypothetical protein